MQTITDRFQHITTYNLVSSNQMYLFKSGCEREQHDASAALRGMGFPEERSGGVCLVLGSWRGVLASIFRVIGADWKVSAGMGSC